MGGRKNTYQPMEWGMLISDVGGRPFQAWKTQWFGETERVVEYYVQPGSTEPREGIGWNVSNTIKCRDKQQAGVVADIMREAYEEAEKGVQDAKAAQRRALAATEERMRKMVEAGR